MVFATAILASSLSDDLLGRAIHHVVDLLKRRDLKPDMIRSSIQMIGAFRFVNVSSLFYKKNSR